MLKIYKDQDINNNNLNYNLIRNYYKEINSKN